MTAMTNYLEKKLLDHTLGKTAFTMPNPVYLGLFKADPGEAGTLTQEVTGGSYARQAITSTMAAADATAGSSSNSASITFGPATADWGAITHVAILDASTAGNALLVGALAVSKTINSGDSLQLAANQFTVTFA